MKHNFYKSWEEFYFGYKDNLPLKQREKFEKQFIDVGYDDTYFWNLDCTIIKFIVFFLKQFKSHDPSMDSRTERMVEKLIGLLTLYLEPDVDCDTLTYTKKRNSINTGLRLFTYVLPRLWT